jgi:hypothetical protein
MHVVGKTWNPAKDKSYCDMSSCLRLRSARGSLLLAYPNKTLYSAVTVLNIVHCPRRSSDEHISLGFSFQRTEKNHKKLSQGSRFQFQNLKPWLSNTKQGYQPLDRM